jgi:hypothetical protein
MFFSRGQRTGVQPSDDLIQLVIVHSTLKGGAIAGRGVDSDDRNY